MEETKYSDNERPSMSNEAFQAASELLWNDNGQEIPNADFDEALRLLDQAEIDMGGRTPAIAFERTHCYEKINDSDIARTLYEEALSGYLCEEARILAKEGLARVGPMIC